MSLSCSLLGVFVLLVAVLWGALVRPIPAQGSAITCRQYPSLCNLELSPGEALSPSDGAFPVGRWKAGSASLDAIHTHKGAVARLFQLKQWAFMSVASQHHFLCITPVQFGYIEDLYVYLADRHTGTKLFEYQWRLPLGSLLGLGTLEISPTSTSGCTSHRGWGENRLSICFADEKWFIDVDVTSGGKTLKARVQVHKDPEALILWYPLGGECTEVNGTASCVSHQPGYVHKEAGMRATGTYSLDLEETHLEQGVAVFDWTKSFAQRETRWRWVSLACAACTVQVTDGESSTYLTSKRVGLSLSKLVYDVVDGDIGAYSTENVMWVDGLVAPIHMDIHVHVPVGAEGTDQWTVRGSGGGWKVNLTFTPHGLREDHTGHKQLGILSQFQQPYGTFEGSLEGPWSNGTVYKVVIEDEYGIVESHWAIW